MAHYITADLDAGPIIEQVAERVDGAYTPNMLAAVGRDSECTALARAGRYQIEHSAFTKDDKTVIFR